MSFLYFPEMSTSLDTCSCKRSRQEVFTLTSLNDCRMKGLNKPACKLVFGQKTVPKIPGLCTI